MELAEKSRLYSATTTQLFEDFVVLGGKDCYLWGQLGESKPRWFLDFAASVGAAPLGHNPSAVAEAVARQFRKGIAAVDNDWQIREAILLKERLAQLTPGDFPKKVFLCNSGAEAVNAAVKIGFDVRPGKTVLLGFRGSFHGRVGYALDLTDSRPVQKEGFPPGAEVLRLPFPDRDDPNYSYQGWLEEVLRTFLVWDREALGSKLDQVNSFVFELIQGEGGIRVADPAAIKFLINHLRAKGILIIVDEVQTGIGRTGKFLVSERYGIIPDMVCLSKALGGGAVATGAVIFRAELDFTRKGRHSNTFGGNSVAAAVSLAVLNAVLGKDFLNIVAAKGAFLAGELHKAVRTINLTGKFVARTSGLGLMRKIDFLGPDGKTIPGLQEKIERRCLEKGLVVVHAGNSAIRFLPPLTITVKEIKQGVGIFTEAVGEVLESL